MNELQEDVAGKIFFTFSIIFETFYLNLIFFFLLVSSEHYQWNMDIFGISGVEAEAELLSAIVSSFQTMGITEHDVGIKVR